MQVIGFQPAAWESWGLERQPLIATGMPVLIDDDLLFEDADGVRPSVIVNRWLRELPASGAPAQRTWEVYAGILRQWLEFFAERTIDPLASERPEMRVALGAYAEHRLTGPLELRLAPATWNLHMNVLSGFYKWAVAEGYASAVPFTYRTAIRTIDQMRVEVERNMAALRKAKPHSTIKYLENDFADLFVKALAGLRPDGQPDDSYRGRQLGRNAAMGELVLASGLRRKEFTHLLIHEIPPLPNRRTVVPVPFLVSHNLGKGGKQRTTWITYEALVKVHEYIAMERAIAVSGSTWRPARGEPLLVERPDWEGATINGKRMSWRVLTAQERLRLVEPGGGSSLLALQYRGEPFVDWATVFRRASRRIRAAYEPRFPIVSPHRLRHTFAMATLEKASKGYYQQAAALVKDADANAALALLLTKTDPMSLLRDLLGHSSVLTTEIYVKRLDVTRIFREAYEAAGRAAGLLDPEAQAEADAEFTDEDEA